MQLEGVIPPMATPVVSRRGEIDTESLESLVRFFEDAGVHGLFPAGTTGEFFALSRAQRETLIRNVAKTASECPVLAGCGGTSLVSTEERIEVAKDAGADTAAVVTPYYTKTTQPELCGFYERVADSSDLPIVLYDIPQRTGLHLSPESVSRLATHSNIVGLKDTSRDFTFFVSVEDKTHDSFSLLIGAPELSLAALDLGADGMVAAPSNYIPEALADMYESYRSGDRQQSFSLFQSVLLPFVELMQSFPTIAVTKYLLQQRGYDVGDPVVPNATLSSDERNRLNERYDRILKQDE